MVNSVCFCVLLLTVPVLMRPDTDWDVNGIDVTGLCNYVLYTRM